MTLALACVSRLQAAPATLPATVELRQLGELMVPFQAGLPIPSYEPQARPRMDLSDGWHLQRMALDSGLSLTARTPETVLALEQEGKGVHRVEFDDRLWPTAAVPAVVNPPPDDGPNGVWYRRRFTLPISWQGKRVLLHCLAANYLADVWVNGRHVGYHEGGFTPFSFDITGLLSPTATNLLAIRVDNPPWKAAGDDRQQSLLPPGPADWWNATGLLRDVYLESVPPVSVVRADVRVKEGPSELTDTGLAETVQVTAVLRNASEADFTGRLAFAIFPTRVSEGNLTATRAESLALVHQPVEVVEGKATAQITVPAHTVSAWSGTFTTEELSDWSPQGPHVYVLEAALRSGDDRLLDHLDTQFGVRALTVDSKEPRLLLNRKPLVLLGVNRVEDDASRGRAVSYQDGLRLLLDLRSVKWLGANFVRLGHAVPHPFTTVLADRLGLICWEEIPATALRPEAMQLQWEARHIARQMLLEMLYQDYNRPSVGFWGVGHLLATGGVHRDFVRDLADMGRFLDGTRLIGESALLDERSPSQTEGDVVGYAFAPSIGAKQDALADALATLDRRHEALPAKPIIITEYGALAGADATAWDRQAALAEDLLPALAARPYVAGGAWWSLADFLSPEGVRPTGILSRDRRVTRQVRETLLDQFRFFRRQEQP